MRIRLGSIEYLKQYPKNGSFANHFNEHSFLALTVKLGIKNLLPGPKIQFTAGNGNDHFPAKELALQMSISIVFAGLMMAVFFYIIGSDGF